MNAKKGACNGERISEEEHVVMCDRMRKGDFEHSNKESNGNSRNEEEIQLPMSGRKVDAKHLNKKKILMKRKSLEDVSVGQKVQLINTMRK